MHLTNSPNTCSMTELCGIYANDAVEMESQVKALITEAKGHSRKGIYACMHKHIHKQFGEALQNAGFAFIGRYPGNSAPWVYLYVYGLERPKAAAPKAAVKKLTLRNTLRRVRKPIQK